MNQKRDIGFELIKIVCGEKKSKVLQRGGIFNDQKYR